jgi:hypothetical protein
VASFLANSEPRRHLHDIYKSTQGVVFFGTPHLGSAHSHLHTTILKLCGFFTTSNTVLAQRLQHDEFLQLNHKYYVDISHEFKDVYIWEEYPTLIAGASPLTVRQLLCSGINTTHTAQLVDFNSAVANGLVSGKVVKASTDHVRMVKYDSPNNDIFKAVLHHLHEIMSGVSLSRKRKDCDNQEVRLQKRRHIGARIPVPHALPRTTLTHQYAHPTIDAQDKEHDEIPSCAS